MNGPHAGRVVLITGAGGGVGRGYALLFAMGGAKVGRTAVSAIEAPNTVVNLV